MQIMNLNADYAPPDYTDLYFQLTESGLGHWAQLLPAQLQAVWQGQAHGHLPSWQAALKTIAAYPVDCWSVTANAEISFETTQPLTDWQQQTLITALQTLHPWRKGPFKIHQIVIDSEWRCGLKWARIAPILNLTGRTVLDVGSGNGYYGWRMLAAGARLVIGIDPMPLFVLQFQALQQLLPQRPPLWVLPIGIESLPDRLKAFDTVFSMGVLYHRRSPLDHLRQLRHCLRKNGLLVLETLIIAGDLGQTLTPEHSYAKMPNVWFIPSLPTLTSWLKRCEFTAIEVVDVTITTTEEQRATPWMRFESLANFLDPQDPRYTIEGLPAPQRAILIAKAS